MNKENPIQSYGIIVFYTFESQRRYLLFKRRDTYEYMNFLRGFWKTNSDIFCLFNGMTHDERMRLLNYSFFELWDDLWIDYKSNYRLCYKYSYEKFLQIKDSLPFIIDSTDTDLLQPPWGFPKGRRDKGEGRIECAMREFKEETGIHKHVTLFVSKNKLHVPWFIESYKGTDGKYYEVCYFVGSIDEEIYPCLIRTSKGIRKTTVSHESESIGWFTLEQTKDVLCERLFKLLNRVENTVKAILN